EAAAGADGPLARQAVGEAETRSDVVLVPVDDSPRKSVFTRDHEYAGDGVEQAAAIEGVDRLGVELISYAKIKREARGDFPIVLEEAAAVEIALGGPVEQLLSIRGGGEAQHEIGERGAGARSITG